MSAPTDIAPDAPTAETLAPRDLDPTRRPGATLATGKVPLGEELPVFCERCGYSFHGMRQDVCPTCTVRQFHCPECDHHQPINTLRPAFQKILGRVRTFTLAVTVFIALNFFGWLLFAWAALGYEMAYEYKHEQTFSRRVAAPPNSPQFRQRINTQPGYGPREFDMEAVFGFSLFALAFGLVGRMFLLRWRRGYLVGLSLSALACIALIIGAHIRRWDRSDVVNLPSPLTGEFLGLLALTATTITLGAATVWGIWTALVHVFLPKRTSQALLDWQRSLSNPPAAHLARE